MRDLLNIADDMPLLDPQNAFFGLTLQIRQQLKISQNSQENTCAWVYFLIKLGAWSLQPFLKTTLSQMLSSKFSKTFKNTFFAKHIRATASARTKIKKPLHSNNLMFLFFLWNTILSNSLSYLFKPLLPVVKEILRLWRASLFAFRKERTDELIFPNLDNSYLGTSYYLVTYIR